MVLTSIGAVPGIHAVTKPSDTACYIYPDKTLTWAELELRATQWARLFQSKGVVENDLVTVALTNTPSFHEVVFGIWKSGATPNVVSPNLPDHEFRDILNLVQPKHMVVMPGKAVPEFDCSSTDVNLDAYSSQSFPSLVSGCWRAMTSGGSTGKPKVIVDRKNAAVEVFESRAKSVFQMRPGMVMLNPGPLYHGSPFMVSHFASFIGCTVVSMPRFDAEETLRLIERHRVSWVCLVPTMMHRIMALPRNVRESYDVSSLEAVWHMAAPCAAWLKEAWINWLGAEKIWELYGATEGIGGSVIRGDAWRKKRGSVGRPSPGTDLRIYDDRGVEMAPGVTGEIYIKIGSPASAPYYYIGAKAKLIGEYQSVGDIGHIDEDGYLYLSDKRSDLILRGGANIYPAEVESALDEHEKVGSSAVVGLPSEDLGQRVHAIVQPRPGCEIDLKDLHDFVSRRLAKYKLPESYEILDAPLRNDAGKVRRSALRDERVALLERGDEFRMPIDR